MKSICVPVLAGLISLSGSAWAHDHDHEYRHEHEHRHHDWYEHHERHHGYGAPVVYQVAPRYGWSQPVVVRQAYPAPMVVYQTPQVIYRDQVVYQEPPRYYGGYQSMPPAPRAYSNDRLAGTAVGALAGGVVGNQIGKGNGRVIATAVGAVIGGAVGGHVAAY